MIDYLEIPLTGQAGAGRFVKVSPEDYVYLSRFKWTYKEGYAVGRIGKKEMRMHRLIMREDDPEYVIDHINRDRLDNRRSNLRRFTIKENANNRSNNTFIEAFGEKKTIAEWTEDPRCAPPYSVLQSRLRRETLPEAAILAPHPLPER